VQKGRGGVNETQSFWEKRRSSRPNPKLPGQERGFTKTKTATGKKKRVFAQKGHKGINPSRMSPGRTKPGLKIDQEKGGHKERPLFLGVCQENRAKPGGEKKNQSQKKKSRF